MNAENPRFAGKIALVTGGSRGIGRAIALRLGREGADVAVTWFRNPEGAKEVVSELQEMGRKAIAVRAMLKDPVAPERILREVQDQLGDVQLLVSNAATGTIQAIREARDSHWDWTMQTNAFAFLRLVQAAEALESVVALTSLGARRVIIRYGTIGVSKAVLETMIRYLAIEMAPTCRFNAISAGVVDTYSLRQFPRAQEILDRWRESTPMGRLVTPEDVAAGASFLLSSDAQMITGQVVTIDGGYDVLAYTGPLEVQWEIEES